LKYIKNATKEYTDRMLSTEDAVVEDNTTPRRSRKRKAVLLYYDDNNNLKKVQPPESSWYLLYVSNPTLSDRFRMKFRRRFWILYEPYLELVKDTYNDGFRYGRSRMR
jgi:hypothetical protein